MKGLTEAVGHADTNGLPTEFSPCAGYFNPMDCLIYLKQDLSYRAVRLSPFVTILLHPRDDVATGIKIKGFRSVIESVRAILRSDNKDISDRDAVQILAILETAFTASLGDMLIDEIDAKRRKKYEAQAREIAKEAGVFQFEELRQAA